MEQKDAVGEHICPERSDVRWWGTYQSTTSLQEAVSCSSHPEMQQSSLTRCKPPYVRPRGRRRDPLACEQTSKYSDASQSMVTGAAHRPALSGPAKIQAPFSDRSEARSTL